MYELIAEERYPSCIRAIGARRWRNGWVTAGVSPLKFLFSNGVCIGVMRPKGMDRTALDLMGSSKRI